MQLLAAVLEREEHRDGGRAARPVQRTEQIDGIIGRRFGLAGEPGARDRPRLLEVGRHQMHDFVQRRRQGDLCGGDRGPPCVGGLENAGVENDLAGSGRGGGAQSHLEFLVVCQAARYPRHGRRHPLVSGDHLLDRPLLRREYLVERRLHNR